jgi:preprotein translocase subunit SecA
MRIFGGDQIKGLMDRLSVPEDQPIENKLISRAIEQAQVKVEGFNFDIRKSLVEYDDVANQQREIVYKLRKRVLQSSDLKEEIAEKLEHQLEKIVLVSQKADGSGLDKEEVLVGLMEIIPFDEGSKEKIKKELERINDEKNVKELLVRILKDVYSLREEQLGSGIMRQVEKFAYLGSIDKLWIDHIDVIDGLREGVRLRAYGQRDPLVEFKNEAYDMFEGLLDRIDAELARRLFRIGVATPQSEIPLDRARENIDRVDAMGLAEGNSDQTARTGQPLEVPKKDGKKIGRNDPCWCGSGKKWKKCHYPQVST